MKPDYKNWVPKGMLYALFAATAVTLIAALVFGIACTGMPSGLRIALTVICALAFAASLIGTCWCVSAYNAFSYDGARKLSKAIVEGTAAYIKLPKGGVGLDVGCGSGALTIACAKRNTQASMIGVVRWGKEYASFNLPLCNGNAAAEGVKNTSFKRGDATKLDFADGTFDAVTSNYVYHNVTGADKQKLLMETLRVLKKGGTFAIHDLMSPRRYGDMQAFVRQLKAQGYERAELIDTTNGKFMSSSEAKKLGLTGSTLLVGKK